MSTSMLEHPARTPAPTHPKLSGPGREPGIVPSEDATPRAGACPVCGFGATCRIMRGRWGCTACGATWSGGYTY
ncbi:hypothetical protein GCM10010441_62360 [Kitasatospora paracochleata]|uniref:Uncharacterized protein n=1 Tax=Kitasatospora paracochleata TaxID=58354 RepID=A0ABT1J041_9ACTN|nr:hypothetical protein [Kitasatospora paracochleata]MCP2310559.1 hypothetical protein [Kitasatospora paracochleata]